MWFSEHWQYLTDSSSCNYFLWKRDLIFVSLKLCMIIVSRKNVLQRAWRMTGLQIVKHKAEHLVMLRTVLINTKGNLRGHMRSWRSRELRDVAGWGQRVIELSMVDAGWSERNILQVKREMRKWAHYNLKWKKKSCSLYPASFTWTCQAGRRLIEMCKSFWHGMNEQLLAGCPVPLCVLPLNWRTPICPRSSLPLPTLTVARFCLTSKARLNVPLEQLKIYCLAGDSHSNKSYANKGKEI